MVLFDYYLLSFHVVAVAELEHVNARSGINGDMGIVVEGLGADEATGHVYDL